MHVSYSLIASLLGSLIFIIVIIIYEGIVLFIWVRIIGLKQLGAFIVFQTIYPCVPFGVVNAHKTLLGKSQVGISIHFHLDTTKIGTTHLVAIEWLTRKDRFS